MKTVVVAAAEVHSDGQFFFMYQKQEGKTKIETHKALFLLQCYCHIFEINNHNLFYLFTTSLLLAAEGE
jgi:hypothetical protein